ncbi:MAG: serine/threonine-protein kinase, partial [Jatrophihabitantaceae bacterium]
MTGSVWKLPGYVIERQLGAGGSGQVWLAHERSGGAAVAVKLLPAVDRDQLAAVRAEAAMLSALEHPHLLHLREVVPCRQGLALVVDLAVGGSLASLLRSRRRLSPGEVVTAVAPIGAALAYAHNAGVVHGDVTPANLLFTEVGLPLLADLGVARLCGDDSPVSSTPAYVDPAVAAGGMPAPTSDVFMLGALALHALTGDPPWSGESPDQVLAVAAAGDLGDVAARMDEAGVPEQVAEVVGRALELDGARRPTAAEFALDLRHAAEPVAVELGAGRPDGG